MGASESSLGYSFTATPPNETAESSAGRLKDDFRFNDQFYSNQGAAGTCARHAVAKAVCAEVLVRSKGKIVLQSRTVTQLLISKHGGLGADGVSPGHLRVRNATLTGHGGHVYEIMFDVMNCRNDKKKAHVACVDLSKFSRTMHIRRSDNGQLAYPPKISYHAMYVNKFGKTKHDVGDDKRVLRNSWGDDLDHMVIDLKDPSWYDSFYVLVYRLTWKPIGKPAVVLCDRGRWQGNDFNSWPQTPMMKK